MLEVMSITTWLPDSGGLDTIPHGNKVVHVPHILWFFWDQHHLTVYVCVCVCVCVCVVCVCVTAHSPSAVPINRAMY